MAEDDDGAAMWLADHFAESAIVYALGGAIAMTAYGAVPSHRACDLSFFGDADHTGELFDTVDRSGGAFERAAARYDPALLSVYRVRLGRISVDLILCFHLRFQAARERRVRMPCSDGRERWVLSAEDLAVAKLVLGRAHDRADLDALAAAQGQHLDATYLRSAAETLIPPGDDRLRPLETLLARITPVEKL